MNRTNFDFNKHVHRIEIFKSDNGEIRVDHFQVGNSLGEYIKFLNTSNNLLVTGDYGNWVFRRTFIPSANGYVSDGYWIEKLGIDNCNVAKRYDSDATREEIQGLLDGGLEAYGYSGVELSEAKEWYTGLLDHVDDEIDYTYNAYRGYDMPSFIDYENIPFCKTVNVRLNIIFDAFDEICERLKIANNIV